MKHIHIHESPILKFNCIIFYCEIRWFSCPLQFILKKHIYFSSIYGSPNFLFIGFILTFFLKKCYIQFHCNIATYVLCLISFTKKQTTERAVFASLFRLPVAHRLALYAPTFFAYIFRLYFVFHLCFLLMFFVHVFLITFFITMSYQSITV